MAQDVKYNFAPGTDFSKYKTYKWVEVEGAVKPSPLVNDQIIQAVDSQLTAKGLTRTEDDKPSLLVCYQVAINEERQWNATSFGGYGGYGAYGGYGGWGGMGGSTTATSSTIKIGTLVLDMYDVEGKKHVWRGDATKTLNPSKNPQKNQERLQKGIAKLLKNYPPPVKK
ncbi:MAG: DUF4136 domain-containing protein [Acidobacteria bacterium]|nr:MAG: DUF4136 domain-containing protein [Acidobacteriota bacterium]